MQEEHVHAARRTIHLTHDQYMWWSVFRTFIWVVLWPIGRRAHLGEAATAVACIVVSLFLYFLGYLLIRIDGQSPRKYYTTHEYALPQKLRITLAVLLLTIIGSFVTLALAPLFR